MLTILRDAAKSHVKCATIQDLRHTFLVTNVRERSVTTGDSMNFPRCSCMQCIVAVLRRQCGLERSCLQQQQPLHHKPYIPNNIARHLRVFNPRLMIITHAALGHARSSDESYAKCVSCVPTYCVFGFPVPQVMPVKPHCLSELTQSQLSVRARALLSAAATTTTSQTV